MFPERYSDATALNNLSLILNKIKAECRWIINRDEKAVDQIHSVIDHFVNASKPRNFNWQDPQNVIISHRRAFEELCIYLMTSGIPDPQEMSVFRFTTTIKHFENRKRPTK